MDPGRPGRHPGRPGRLEFDQILFFSDAVFAIAFTLLIVDLPGRLGEFHTHGFSSGHALRQAAPGIAGFWLGFAVIGLFWMGHHGLFRYVTGFDRRLVLLNLLFVGLIAFLPYPTALLSASASQTAAVVFYAVCTGAAGLVETIMWAYACRARAGLIADLSPATRRLILLRTARAPAVFIDPDRLRLAGRRGLLLGGDRRGGGRHRALLRSSRFDRPPGIGGRPGPRRPRCLGVGAGPPAGAGTTT